jgi:hypothetical protein
MSLHRLLFDAAAPDESANVGANIRAGDDGTLIGHVSDALKVNFSNTSIAVTATDLDIRDLAFATDSVDVSGSAVSITGDVNVTQGTSPWVVSATDLDIRDLAFATDKVDVSGSAVTVSATDLDIRNLSHTQDSIKIGDGTDFLAIDASGNIGVTDAGGSLTVDAVNLDIRDLTAASDSVASWLNDGAGTALTSTLVSGKQALDVNIVNSITTSDAALANVALANEADAITTTSGAAIASPLANRKYVSLYNNGSKIIYIGAGTVTAANGFPIPPGSLLEARIGAAVAINAISQSGTQDLRVLQAS